MLALILITTMIYYSLKPYVLYFYHMYFVGWDFMAFIKTFSPTFNWLDYNYQILLVAVFMISATVYVIRRSHIAMKEKVFRFGALPLIVYMFMYFIILSVMWIGITFDLVRGRRQ
jgi:hypothetical protein